MPSEAGDIRSLNVSLKKGTTKHPVPEATITEDGIVGDAHAGPGHRQLSLLAQESVKRFGLEAGMVFAPGEFAENLTTGGLDLATVAVLDRLRIGEVNLEVTQIGKSCHGEGCAIFREVGRCVMPREGIFARVKRGGAVRVGDELLHVPRALRLSVITVSDRASRGEYEDRSGPRIRQLLEEFLGTRRWHEEITTTVVPDEAESIARELDRARSDGADVVLTTGGTGIGPRDLTPDVVAQRCDKLIPGIMEHIRTMHGREKPNALLSRGVAGVMGRTLVYTLPGSVRAVEEYMGEILKTMEHLIFMLHGLDVHH